MRAMSGQGNNCIPIAPVIKKPNGVSLTSPIDIAESFLDFFSNPLDSLSDHSIDEATLSPIINSRIADNSPNQLNLLFTPYELESALVKIKSRSTGPDNIHNEMLANLSNNNKRSLLLLFNSLYQLSFVPEDWKKAIVIPLPKPNKPSDVVSSYRPISLTSCLCKLFERIITNRISWYVESKNLICPNQAGFRKRRCTTDHLVQLDLDIKRSFKEKQSTVAVFLDIEKAYDSVWITGLLYKLSKIGIHGSCLAWLSNFLQNRSICIRLGSHSSAFKLLKNGVPQGAVISPLLFNIMLFDFPLPSINSKLLLFADDVTIYSKVKRPIDAEVTLQPYLDKVAKWGKKWKLKFSAAKSSAVSFTRSYKPGDDPLLFINGRRIPNVSKVKFLGLTLDSKLLWKDHIAQVVNKCIKIKNAFSIICKASYAPSLRSLSSLFKSLVRSRIDYGLIVYGSASKSHLNKIDVAARSILRIILGSKPSSPTEVIYAESNTEPVAYRREWLASKYVINLSSNPRNLTFNSIKALFSSSDQWPTRCSPCLLSICSNLKLKNHNLFSLSSDITYPSSIPPPPWSPPLFESKWFPLKKSAASINPQLTSIIFNSLVENIPPPDIIIFTDGSVKSSPPRSTCAIFIPALNCSKSWLLSQGSGIFTAELYGILKALESIYALDQLPPCIHIFSDSSSAIKALSSPISPIHSCISEIKNLLNCLLSSGTKTIIYWIPSHSGITGNEIADNLASDDSDPSSRSLIENSLSTGELISSLKHSWEQSLLAHLHKCKKPCVQMRTKPGFIPWHHSKDRATSTCLHRLRNDHNHLNAFAHRIDQDADPSCRFGCPAIESTKHVLIDCPTHHAHRLNLIRFLNSNRLPLNPQTLLGLDPSISPKTQFKLNNLLSSYLSKTGLRLIA
jgi:ribonuclease HI